MRMNFLTKLFLGISSGQGISMLAYKDNPTFFMNTKLRMSMQLRFRPYISMISPGFQTKTIMRNLLSKHVMTR